MTQNMVKAQTLKPVAVAKDEGEARWWFASLAVIKATAADTGSSASLNPTSSPGSDAGFEFCGRAEAVGASRTRLLAGARHHGGVG